MTPSVTAPAVSAAPSRFRYRKRAGPVADLDVTDRPQSEIRADERSDDPVGYLPEQIECLIEQRELDGCETCEADVKVTCWAFDARHGYTVRCLSRTPCAPVGWEP